MRRGSRLVKTSERGNVHMIKGRPSVEKAAVEALIGDIGVRFFNRSYGTERHREAQLSRIFLATSRRTFSCPPVCPCSTLRREPMNAIV